MLVGVLEFPVQFVHEIVGEHGCVGRCQLWCRLALGIDGNGLEEGLVHVPPRGGATRAVGGHGAREIADDGFEVVHHELGFNVGGLEDADSLFGLSGDPALFLGHLLHHFYALAEDLNPDQLLRHRKAVTAKDSSLPQRAGKALHRLVSARISNSGRASSVPEPYLRRRGGQVVAQPVLRARPDVKMLAEAVLTMMGEPGHQQSSRLRKTKADGDLAVDELQRHVDHYRQTGTISRHRYSLLIAHCHLAAVTYPEQSKVCAEQGVAVGDLLPTQEWGPLLRRAHVHLVALSSMEPGRGTEARWAEVLELLRQGAR